MLINVNNEFDRLTKVIVGLGTPYQHDKAQTAREIQEFPLIPDTQWKDQVLSLSYPTEDLLTKEFRDFVAALENYGIEVLRANPEAAYSFDYTCPRDIGFVIGKQFFISNMAVQSRTKEIATIAHHLNNIDPENVKRFSDDALIEGGDVIQLDQNTVLVGINQRTNTSGFEQLHNHLTPSGFKVVAVPHTRLHLDCCLNPLGLGHLLIHPQSLEQDNDELWQLLDEFEWIRVNNEEREHLATNILSVDPETLIVRDNPYCAATNTELRKSGYRLIEVSFDGTPATGGSFRCASLVLSRQAQ